MTNIFVFGYTEDWADHYWYATTPVRSQMVIEAIAKAHVRALIEVASDELEAIDHLYWTDKQKFWELIQWILEDDGAFIAN